MYNTTLNNVNNKINHGRPHMKYSDEKALHESIIGILNEALEAPAHKSLATKAANASKDASGLTAAERISKNVMQTDRVVIPMSRLVTPSPEVNSHLSRNGYRIHDYEQGLAYHISTPERKERIGKILNKTGATKDTIEKYTKDPSRQGLNTNAHIVISRRPSDVAAMSSGQCWESCQTLGGSYTNKDGSKRVQKDGGSREFVPGIINSGAHIAYLVHNPEDIDKSFHPIARTTLNVFQSEDNGPSHSVIRPSRVYGEEWAGFHESVNKWAEDNFPTVNAHYVRHSASYPEGTQTLHNYSPEHDEFWLNNRADTKMLANHPSGKFLDSVVDEMKKTSVADYYRFSGAKSLLGNPNLLPETEDKLIDGMYSGSRIDHFADIAEYVRQPKTISKVLTRAVGAAHYRTATGLAKNQNTTKSQLHRILDHFAVGKTNVPNENVLVHSGYSPSIIGHVARHPNADESHFEKILSLNELTKGNQKHDPMEAFATHGEALETIARRYTSEGIGKKLIESGIAPDFDVHNPRVINAISEKHPNLLHMVSDSGLHAAISHQSSTKEVADHIIKHSDKIGLIARALGTHGDEDSMTKFENHPHQEIKTAIRLRKLFLESSKK